MTLDKDGKPISDDEIEVDLETDEKDEKGKEVEVDLEDADTKTEREEKARNTAFASMRVENRELKESVNMLRQQMAEFTKRSGPTVPSTPAPAGYPGVPQTDEEWDTLADKDWKKAVDLRSIQNAKSILAQQQALSTADKVLTDAKQKVLAVHPELNDNNSEKSKIYLTILDANPDYLTQPKGPLYAMRDMEDYMENTLGYKRSEIRSAERAGAEREASRQHRIVLNKGGGRVGAEGSGNKVVLSRDEMEFCKFQGIDPKEYARNKQKLSKSNAKEGVTI